MKDLVYFAELVYKTIRDAPVGYWSNLVPKVTAGDLDLTILQDSMQILEDQAPKIAVMPVVTEYSREASGQRGTIKQLAAKPTVVISVYWPYITKSTQGSLALWEEERKVIRVREETERLVGTIDGIDSIEPEPPYDIAKDKRIYLSTTMVYFESFTCPTTNTQSYPTVLT